MKTLVLTTLLVACLTTSAHAGGWFSWDDTNTKLHVPLTLLYIIDYRQTLETIKNPNKYRETNNILGDHPSVKDLTNYMLGAYTLTTLITLSLDKKYSYSFQGIIITIEAYAVNKNYMIGFHGNF